MEYRKTSAHGNADALSRLPMGHDEQFDEEEDDINIISAIHTLNSQLKPTDPETLRKESAKDPAIASVMRCTHEGWPERSTIKEAEEFRKIANPGSGT